MPPALTSPRGPGQPLLQQPPHPPPGFLCQDSHLPPPAGAGLGWERLQPLTGPVSVPGPSGEGGGPGRGCQSQHTSVCRQGLVWHLRAWFQPTGPGLSLSWVTQSSRPPDLCLRQAASAGQNHFPPKTGPAPGELRPGRLYSPKPVPERRSLRRVIKSHLSPLTVSNVTNPGKGPARSRAQLPKGPVINVRALNLFESFASESLVCCFHQSSPSSAPGPLS